MIAPAIPLADASKFRRAATRTRLVRVALSAILLGLIIAAVLLARSPRVTEVPVLPVGSNGVIVLDLSASVETGKLKRIYSSLTQLAETKGGRFGLVIVSGWAYEALAPGTPASELRSVARFFQSQKPPPGVLGYSRARPYFPRNPWAQGFATGTQLSTGLTLARSIILDSKLSEPSVILISDLADAAPDVPLAVAAARSFQENGIKFHVVGIDAPLANAQFWAGLTGEEGSFTPAQLPAKVRLRASAHFPVGLAVVIVLVAGLLAVNEFWGAPLRWGARQDAGDLST